MIAYFVARWNRGVLPVAAALAIILLIFAAVAGPAWFARDKTGFTNPAGKCFVGIARRGSHTLGAVLLNSMDIGGQARQLLDAGFQAEPG